MIQRYPETEHRNARNIILYLVRHAQAVFDGSLQEKLTPEGIQEALNLGKTIGSKVGENEHLTIFYSPTERCKETAELLLQGAKQTMSFSTNIYPYLRSWKVLEPVDFSKDTDFFEKMKASPDRVGYWLKNAHDSVILTKPEQVLRELEGMISDIHSLARSGKSDTVHVVAITHEHNLRVLAERVFGQKENIIKSNLVVRFDQNRKGGKTETLTI